jgi:hypothetical protein
MAWRGAALWRCFRRKMGHLYRVTVSEANDTSSTEKLLLRALVLSLLLHLTLYGTWRVGANRGWWRNITMPAWMQAVSKALTPAASKKRALDLPSQTQLTFVEVDPALATPEPPKEPKFQGARNTLAANPEIKVPSDKPDIEGREKEYLKTTENVEPRHQPAPPAQPPPQAQIAAAPGAPQKSYVPGDLTMTRPSDKAQEGRSDAESAAQGQAQPAHERPRTIAEALARNGMPGEKSRQTGGVPRVSSQSSLDVKGTPIGDYLGQMADAVQQRWDQLLKDQTADTYGKVVLQFRLHPDGKVSDIKLVRNEVSDLLETTCEQALRDPAPYQKWPREMRLLVPTDYYEITFTFYYEAY